MIISQTTVVPITTCDCCMDSSIAFVCSGDNCSYAMCNTCVDRMHTSLHLDGYRCPACRRYGTFNINLPMASVSCLRCYRCKKVMLCSCWYTGVVSAVCLSYMWSPIYAVYTSAGAICLMGINVIYSSCRNDDKF